MPLGSTRHEFTGKLNGDQIVGTAKVTPSQQDTMNLPWRARRTARSRYFMPTGTALFPTSAGTSLAAGERLVEIGGFAILEAPSMAAAIELTKRFLRVHGDGWHIECEVRELDGPRARCRVERRDRGPDGGDVERRKLSGVQTEPDRTVHRRRSRYGSAV